MAGRYARRSDFSAARALWEHAAREASRTRSTTTKDNVRKQCATARKTDEPNLNAQDRTLQNVTGSNLPADRLSADQCDQRRLACSVGGESHQGKRQSPVAWVAFVEETKRMKPTDKAIHGMVSESSGRNVSEPRSGLVKKNVSEGRIPWSGMKAAWHVADWLTRRVTSAGW